MPSALAVQTAVSVKAAIYFAIEFTWRVPCILIPSILSGSHRGHSVCLTHVKSSLLSFCLPRGRWYHFNWYWAGVLIHKYEQTSGCMCPHFRVVSFLSWSKRSLFNTEGIGVTGGLENQGDVNNKKNFGTEGIFVRSVHYFCMYFTVSRLKQVNQ